jgi:HAD superfamily hydrolase (TIGR01509 family)
MDGVIIDSTVTHTEAWKGYLLTHGIEIPDIEQRMLGKHNDEIVRDFFPSGDLTPELIRTHGARKEQFYRDLIAPVFASRLVPGIHDFLSRVKVSPTGLATNAEPANIEFVLERAGLRNCFQAIVSAHDVDRPKPFPDVYLHAAKLLHVAPENCVVFEDSLSGVAAARAAGMRVVGVLTTLSGFVNVDLTIRDFRDSRLNQWVSTLTAPV